MVEYPHTKAVVRLARRRLTDAAKPDQTQCLAGERGANHPCRSPTLPTMRPNLALALAGPPGSHEHQGNGDFRGRIGQYVRRVGHHNSQAPARLEIDVADTHPVVSQHL